MKTLLHQASHATILTPNRRLSAWLSQLYHQQKQEEGIKTWETPDILPLNSWLSRTWQDYSYSNLKPLPTLLTADQETYLWESIVRQSDDNNQLLRVSETADAAKSAFDLLNQWETDTNHPLFTSTDNSVAFKDWAQAFSKLCQKNHWICSSQLLSRLATLIDANEITLDRELILFGFTEISPALKRLAATQFAPETQETNATQIALESEDEEWITAARWAKQLFSHKPDAKIGIVIPSLDKNRNRIKQLMNQVLMNASTTVNITAGQPLAQYPVIQAALAFLDLNKPEIPQHEFSALLASPFFGNAESEYVRRSKLDANIRKDNMDVLRLNELLISDSLLTALIHKSAPKLFQRLQEYLQLAAQSNEKLTYSDWAKRFSQLLHLLGWPGERSLNSDEYQVVEKWFELLGDFSKLDLIATEVHFHTALSTLHRFACKQSFQPKSPDANIQVMGVLEAASLPFDYLWVTGMDDISWPPQPSPNPFIPLRLQRELNMPHATSTRELDYCRQLTEQFSQSARHTIFSYANIIDDLEVNASPLVRQFSEIGKLDLADYTDINHLLLNSVPIEQFDDSVAPLNQPEEAVAGGVSLIKDQALCPFKAYATWRLHARRLEEPLPGLNKRDRGTITHEILESIWSELQTQRNLLFLSHVELENLVTQIIHQVLINSKHARQQRPEFIKLETQRLKRLMTEWLELEKSRPPFKVVKCEADLPVSLGQLHLNARVDRIDELETGDHLIIDYKTGQSLNVNNWFDERPEEPQLPIYALHDNSVAAIAFAKLYTDNCAFDGISRDDLQIAGIKPIEKKRNAEPDWTSQLKRWRDELTKLANEFHHGDATVNPKNGNDTCSVCHLQPFCRIHEVS